MAEGGGSDPASLPQFLDGQRRGGFSEDVLHALLWRLLRQRRNMIRTIDDLEGDTVFKDGQAQGEVGDRGRSTMLDGEGGCIPLAPEVEVGVALGVKLRGAAQRLAGATMRRPLSCMVDHQDGEVVLTLQLAQEGQQRRDLVGHVFVNAVQTHEGVEDQQLGPMVSDRLGQGLAFCVEVEPQTRRGDHLDVDVGQLEVRGAAQRIKTVTHDVQGILGGKDQHTPRSRDGEAPQTWSAGGHGDTNLEREEGLAALGFATEDADRLVGPELLDEPVPVGWPDGKLVCVLDRQHQRRRLRLDDVGFGGGGGGLGTVKTSR